MSFRRCKYFFHKCFLLYFSFYCSNFRIFNGEWYIIKIFLDRGHKIDDEKLLPHSTTALYEACKSNNIDAVKILLRHGASPYSKQTTYFVFHNIKKQAIFTPLLLAARENNLEIVAELLKEPIPSEILALTCLECQKFGFTKAYPLIDKACLDTLKKEADQAYQENNFKRAEFSYAIILTKINNDNEKHQVLYQLALCFQHLGKNELAIQKLEHCLSIRKTLLSRQNPLQTAGLQKLITEAQNTFDIISSVMNKNQKTAQRFQQV